METLSASSSIDPKQKIYPSTEAYHQTHHMHPQAHPAYPIHHFHPHQGYPYHPSSPFPVHGNYPFSAAQNPYPGYSYYHHQPFNNPIVQQSKETAAFGRVMLILMIVLIGSMGMMSLVMWFLYGTYVPEFQVESFRVSDFSATNTTVSGVWDGAVAVGNPNQELAIEFEHVRSLIFYRGIVLGVGSLQSFEIENKMKFDLNFSVAAAADRTVKNSQGWVLPSLARDWSNGVVIFGLRLALVVKFSSPNQVYRRDRLTVWCDDLRISFSTATNEGKLSPGFGRQCLIRIRDSQVS